MYGFTIDHRLFTATRDGRPLSLTDCLAAVHGTGNATVVRLADGATVVRRAGSSTEVEYAPTGRRITRRMTRWAREAWREQMRAQHEANIEYQRARRAANQHLPTRLPIL